MPKSTKQEMIDEPKIWSHKEEGLFISLWLNPERQTARSTYHTKPFYEGIAKEMVSRGCKVTGSQCQSKATRLRRAYYKAIGQNKTSGAAPSTFCWLNEMAALGDRPAATPPIVLDSLSKSSASNVESEGIVQNIKGGVGGKTYLKVYV